MVEPTGRPLRVAVVDDDATIRTLLRLVLAASGAATVIAEAEDAPGALINFADCAPDVLLVDHELGASCGLDLIAPLRAATPDAMVAMFSSLPAIDAEAAALRAGAFAYYEKTLLGDALVERLCRDHARYRGGSATV